ncbi:MAG: 23S rRNA (adenine(2503)-C(2))-methyltransferase RlmN [Deltaproteobacteria bacterium]
MKKIYFKDLDIEEIEKIIYDITQEKFRAKQIFTWIHRGAASFEQMTDIPTALRNKLEQDFSIYSFEVRNLQKSSEGTFKFLFGLEDGNSIESVLMKYKYGYSACISTQVGCKMGCRFCASTKCGFIRNLSAGEIVEQILSIQRETGNRVSKIVFMGIGEPLENYENVIKAIKLLNNPLGLNIGLRNISISTCGLIPAIKKLETEKLPITLSISLHAPNDIIRDKIMPINKKYPIKELIAACKEYTKSTKRKIYFEYVMIDDVNDSEKQAYELSRLVKGILAHINLIQLNPIGQKEFKRSSPIKIKKFMEILESQGVSATLRRELGSEIEAACGQLRLKNNK